MRINKYLSSIGVCSRRKADDLINQKRVKINGIFAHLGQYVNIETDLIELDKQKLSYCPKFEYWVVNKPKGIISTTSDELNRKNVISLVNSQERLYPVGRLDADSEGLIILTNDGELTQRLSHPSNKFEKVYYVEAKGQKILSPQAISQIFTSGLNIDGKRMKASKVEIVKLFSHNIQLNITLLTGYNRQIRKMCDKIGLSVNKLVRIRYANLDLLDLKLASGQCLKIDKKDIL